MKLTAIPGDTTPDAFWRQVEIFRGMTPIRRMELALEWGDTVRAITADGVRSRHPDWTEKQVKLEAIRLAIGDELFHAAYPEAGLP